MSEPAIKVELLRNSFEYCISDEDLADLHMTAAKNEVLTSIEDWLEGGLIDRSFTTLALVDPTIPDFEHIKNPEASILSITTIYGESEELDPSESLELFAAKACARAVARAKRNQPEPPDLYQLHGEAQVEPSNLGLGASANVQGYPVGSAGLFPWNGRETSYAFSQSMWSSLGDIREEWLKNTREARISGDGIDIPEGYEWTLSRSPRFELSSRDSD